MEDGKDKPGRKEIEEEGEGEAQPGALTGLGCDLLAPNA